MSHKVYVTAVRNEEYPVRVWLGDPKIVEADLTEEEVHDVVAALMVALARSKEAMNV